MAETIITFQSQLSGVMETVFKAAMYEITRLVEDSFLEEMTRCREQVETLKRRLKWSESRRRERDGDTRSRCSECGRVDKPRATVEKSLKQENAGQEDSSQDSDEETLNHEGEEAQPEAHGATKATQSMSVHNDKLDGLLKEEGVQIAPETSESAGWGVNLEETDSSGLPGPSKRFTDQKIPKCHVNWETDFNQNQDGHSGDPSEPLFQNRHGTEGLADFDKTGYGEAGMMDMGHFDGLQSSPYHMGENLSYVGHYDEDLEAPEGADHQVQSRRVAVSSPAGSPPKINTDVGGEFSCLLINEDGYLQDPNILYPEQMSGDSGGRLSFRGQGVRIDQTVDSTGGPPYSCNQCGKTFTQVCNLKVHQRIHSGQGLHLCSHCGKGFPSFSDLKKHKCGQTRDKPYCCTVCGNKFSRLWNLKLHRRIHTQEKPHQCSMCDKSFTRADILKVHQRTHTGERPYCCAVCGLSFKRLDHLKSHQRKHMTDL